MSETIIHFTAGASDFTILLEQMPRLPLANIRKLFQLLFSPWEHNEEAIQTVTAWLPEAIAQAKSAWGLETVTYSNGWRNIEWFTRDLPPSMAPGDRRKAISQQRQINRMLISALKGAKADYEKLVKIQQIFNEQKEK